MEVKNETTKMVWSMDGTDITPCEIAGLAELKLDS